MCSYPKAKPKLLIGCTGGFDAKSIDCLLKELLLSESFEIKVVMTRNAMIIAREAIGDDIEEYGRKMGIVMHGEDEFNGYDKNKGNVLHIELRRWADAMLLAPLTANTLAKITNGFCDNLLTCIVRAWDFTKPVLYSLTMDDLMFNHFLTKKQLTILTETLHFIAITENHTNLPSTSIILSSLLSHLKIG